MKFYCALLNDPKLLQCAREHGYQLAFLPPPHLQKYVEKFAADPAVRLYDLNRQASYCEIFAASDLVVTDYSSVVFDFAYLRKPVIYTQFDKAEFFAKHNYSPGYFDYEKDGFGEVEYDLTGTVNRIIEYLENGCRLKDRYRERIDGFFAFNDRNNCRRVFEKIINIT